MKMNRRLMLASTFSLITATAAVERANAILFSGGGSGGGGGGAETELVKWTITEESGSNQTNVPIQIYVPFSAATDPITGLPGAYTFLSTDALKLYDADGVTQIECQEDNACSDMTPDIRGKTLHAILPLITASTTRTLTIKKVANTSPTAGTDTTAAEILATGFSCPIDITVDYTGTVYRADAATGLAAGAWSNKNAAANLGTWFDNTGGGGYVTQYFVYCPFKDGGGTGSVTTDNIGCFFTVTAYKAQRGAVSVGNPILGIKVQWWTECGWIGVTPYDSVRDHYFDLTVTCGTNTSTWAGSAPARTLTIANNTAYSAGWNEGGATISGASFFTKEDLGSVITDGTGEAMIKQINSGTSIEIAVCAAFASSTLTSGNWKIRRISQCYAASLPMQEIWYGGSLAITSEPLLDSCLGTVFNGTTGGPADYFKATRYFLPYKLTPAGVNHSAKIAILDGVGTHPGSYGNGYIGEMYAYQGSTGSRTEIAPTPGFHVEGLIKPDADGKRRIFESSKKSALYPMHWRDQTTGKPMRLNNGTNYYWAFPFGSPVLPQTGYNAHNNRLSLGFPQFAHHALTEHIPYWFTGDLYWVEKIDQKLFWLWADTPNEWGTGFNRCTGQCDEQRGNGWVRRDWNAAYLMHPDRNPAPLGWPKSDVKSWIDGNFQATGTIGGNPRPGINIALVNNTAYVASGYRSMSSSIGGNNAIWQGGYSIMADFQSWGWGTLTADGKAFTTWYAELQTGPAASADVVPNWIAPTYYLPCTMPDGTDVSSWADVYRSLAISWDANGVGAARRIVTGTGMTLSGLTGSGITLTLPAGYVTNGQSFYVDGFVRDWSALSLCITPNIVSGGTGYAVGDQVTLAGAVTGSSKTQVTAPVVTVSSISGGGGTGPITGITVSNRGVITNSGGVASWSDLSINFTQASTTGSGTGATFGGNTAPDQNEGHLLRYGTAKITAVSGDQITMEVTAGSGGWVTGGSYKYPFAKTALTTNLLMIPAPAPGGDVNGANIGYGPTMPVPQSGFNDYYDIIQSAIIMCDKYGMPNAAAAKSWITTNYTGGNDSKWGVA